MKHDPALPLTWRMRATAWALLIPLLLTMMSFERLAKWLSGKPAKHPRHDVPFDDQALLAWVNRVLHRLGGPWRNTCLRRSAVLYYLLRRGGRPVQLLIGVKRGSEGAVDAHAWLMLDGQVYLETDVSQPAMFRVIARFPDDG